MLRFLVTIFRLAARCILMIYRTYFACVSLVIRGLQSFHDNVDRFVQDCLMSRISMYFNNLRLESTNEFPTKSQKRKKCPVPKVVTRRSKKSKVKSTKRTCKPKTVAQEVQPAEQERLTYSQHQNSFSLSHILLNDSINMQVNASGVKGAPIDEKSTEIDTNHRLPSDEADESYSCLTKPYELECDSNVLKAEDRNSNIDAKKEIKTFSSILIPEENKTYVGKHFKEETSTTHSQNSAPSILQKIPTKNESQVRMQNRSAIEHNVLSKDQYGDAEGVRTETDQRNTFSTQNLKIFKGLATYKLSTNIENESSENEYTSENPVLRNSAESIPQLEDCEADAALQKPLKQDVLKNSNEKDSHIFQTSDVGTDSDPSIESESDICKKRVNKDVDANSIHEGHETLMKENYLNGIKTSAPSDTVTDEDSTKIRRETETKIECKNSLIETGNLQNIDFRTKTVDSMNKFPSIELEANILYEEMSSSCQKAIRDIQSVSLSDITAKVDSKELPSEKTAVYINTKRLSSNMAKVDEMPQKENDATMETDKLSRKMVIQEDKQKSLKEILDSIDMQLSKQSVAILDNEMSSKEAVGKVNRELKPKETVGNVSRVSSSKEIVDNRKLSAEENVENMEEKEMSKKSVFRTITKELVSKETAVDMGNKTLSSRATVNRSKESVAKTDTKELSSKETVDGVDNKEPSSKERVDRKEKIKPSKESVVRTVTKELLSKETAVDMGNKTLSSSATVNRSKESVAKTDTKELSSKETVDGVDNKEPSSRERVDRKEKIKPSKESVVRTDITALSSKGNFEKMSFMSILEETGYMMESKSLPSTKTEGKTKSKDPLPHNSEVEGNNKFLPLKSYPINEMNPGSYLPIRNEATNCIISLGDKNCSSAGNEHVQIGKEHELDVKDSTKNEQERECTFKVTSPNQPEKHSKVKTRNEKVEASLEEQQSKPYEELYSINKLVTALNDEEQCFPRSKTEDKSKSDTSTNLNSGKIDLEMTDTMRVWREKYEAKLKHENSVLVNWINKRKLELKTHPFESSCTVSHGESSESDHEESPSRAKKFKRGNRKNSAKRKSNLSPKSPQGTEAPSKSLHWLESENILTTQFRYDINCSENSSYDFNKVSSVPYKEQRDAYFAAAMKYKASEETPVTAVDGSEYGETCLERSEGKCFKSNSTKNIFSQNSADKGLKAANMDEALNPPHLETERTQENIEMKVLAVAQKGAVDSSPKKESAQEIGKLDVSNIHNREHLHTGIKEISDKHLNGPPAIRSRRKSLVKPIRQPPPYELAVGEDFNDLAVEVEGLVVEGAQGVSDLESGCHDYNSDLCSKVDSSAKKSKDDVPEGQKKRKKWKGKKWYK